MVAPGTWHRWRFDGTSRGDAHGVFADCADAVCLRRAAAPDRSVVPRGRRSGGSRQRARPPRGGRAGRRVSVGRHRLGRHGVVRILLGVDQPADVHRRLRRRVVGGRTGSRSGDAVRHDASRAARERRGCRPRAAGRARAARSADDRRGEFVLRGSRGVGDRHQGRAVRRRWRRVVRRLRRRSRACRAPWQSNG